MLRIDLRVACVAGALGLLSVATSPAALAADPNSWSGFNVSVGGGAAKADTGLNVGTQNRDQLDILDLPPPLLQFIGEATGSSSLNDDGWTGFGTLQAGYDHQFGNFVVGAFANYDFHPGHNGSSNASAIDGELSIGILPPLIVVGGIPINDYAYMSSSVELKNTWSIGGRLGYLLTPNTLIYGLGGYTEAKFGGQVDLDYLNLATGPQTLSLRVPDELRGYFIGGGGEVRIASNVALRLEYRYANYRGQTASASSSYSFDALAPLLEYSNSAGIHADLDSQIHTVRGAVVLQLGE